MIRILAKKKDSITDQVTLPELRKEAAWYWLDICEPDDKERETISRYYPFMHQQLKDEHRYRKRPHIKIYQDYFILSMQAVNPSTLKPHELHLFCGKSFLITRHSDNLKSINDVWHDCRKDGNLSSSDSQRVILRRLIERLIEQYYMVGNLLEDQVDALNVKSKRVSVNKLNSRVYQIRSELLGFRRAVMPLQDIFERIISSTYIRTDDEEEIYLHNINESLDRLTHMIESNMEMTSDIRDSYLALTTYRTNSIMQTLTVITTIFMPLSFIAGIYGMNFQYMPELKWRGGYFLVLGLMLGIAIIMTFWFRKKGWFEK
ncbi:magnesium/cobalt transporter CorA [Sporolactobacillus sp. Y61]|jgi:magnesium transporter|uniref:Magnesium transport protein CorA n=1 Tax=Sporolactobacillus sp. Y61 TaxID=3160863 RepID=A0AAU8IDN7_9BACL|nr:magnesium/cobalt transporter CorA [Sporolactobacillus sp. THM19-2]RYL93336.1 magnesium/cobalt transporter CorA [Sporolactobacillus sp. THM19-2]